MADYTQYVHEFETSKGETRYAVGEWIPANGQYIRQFDKTERKLTGCFAEFGKTPASIEHFQTRRQALRRARHLYGPNSEE